MLGWGDAVPKHDRRDIDGLRAISVLGVLLYHAGISAVPGGFVGVDVFFVISGYLISRGIYQRLAAGEFTFIDFYERRARRILPAYFFVSTLTAAAAYVFFLPDRFVEFSKSLIASSLFSANIFFWMRADYFGPAAETQPLLHYWSLGVEEQFYLLFPVLALLLWKFGLRVVATTLAILLVGSFIASQWMLSVSPTNSFYWLPFRAWELFIGCVLALPFAKPPKTRLIGSIASAAGVVVILLALTLYSSSLPFPGIGALAPCIGAALIIWGGQRENVVSRLIGLEPLNYIGRISYSLYLVHWPIIVFARQLYPDAPLLIFLGGTIAASLGLAAFSYHFVETPTRRRNGFWKPILIFALSGTGVVASLAFASFSVSSGGFPGRLPTDVRQILAYKYNRFADYREGKCFLRPDQTYADIDRAACLPTEGPVALLWGDSFAAHYTVGLRPVLENQGFVFAQLNASGCPPIVGRDFPQRPHCKAFNDSALEWIKSHRPKLVIMSASWFYDDQAMQSVTKALSEFPAETAVVILGPSPRYRESVPVILAGRWLRGDRSTFSDGEVSVRIFHADKTMKAKLSETSALYVSVLEAICPGQKCPMYASETPIHFDTGHLTDVGSKLFAEKIKALIGLAWKAED